MTPTTAATSSQSAARFARTLCDALAAAGWAPGRSAFRSVCPLTGLDAGPLTGTVAGLRRPGRAGLALFESRKEDPALAALDVAAQLQEARREAIEEMQREAPKGATT